MLEQKQLDAALSLTYRGRGWLQRLKGPVRLLPVEVFISETDPIPPLSPRKREKRASSPSPDPADYLTRRILLRLLAHRVLSLALADYAPAQKYPLHLFSHSL